MTFKFFFAALLVFLLAAVGAASAAEVSFDTSAVPKNPVAGTAYTIPVTLSGDDVAIFGFKVTYNKEAANVEINAGTVNAFMKETGGEPGRNTLVVLTPETPCTFSVTVTPTAFVNVSMSFTEIKDLNNSSVPVSGSLSENLTFRIASPTPEETKKPGGTTPSRKPQSSASPSASPVTSLPLPTASASPDAPAPSVSDSPSVAASATPGESGGDKKSIPGVGIFGLLAGFGAAGLLLRRKN